MIGLQACRVGPVRPRRLRRLLLDLLLPLERFARYAGRRFDTRAVGILVLGRRGDDLALVATRRRDGDRGEAGAATLRRRREGRRVGEGVQRPGDVVLVALVSGVLAAADETFLQTQSVSEPKGRKQRLQE